MGVQILFSILIGASAWASCPQLVGDYTCTNGKVEGIKLAVRQSLEGKFTRYQLQGREVLANGEWEENAEKHGQTEIIRAQKAECVNEYEMYYEEKTNLIFEGRPFGLIYDRSLWARKDNGDLVIYGEGYIENENGRKNLYKSLQCQVVSDKD